MFQDDLALLFVGIFHGEFSCSLLKCNVPLLFCSEILLFCSEISNVVMHQLDKNGISSEHSVDSVLERKVYVNVVAQGNTDSYCTECE